MKYVANPVEVDAFQIVEVRGFIVPNGLTVVCNDGKERIATEPMCSRYSPVPGDYWVIQSDGYAYLNPKDVFERKYRPAEPNALELGAAARRAGIVK